LSCNVKESYTGEMPSSEATNTNALSLATRPRRGAEYQVGGEGGLAGKGSTASAQKSIQTSLKKLPLIRPGKKGGQHRKNQLKGVIWAVRTSPSKKKIWGKKKTCRKYQSLRSSGRDRAPPAGRSLVQGCQKTQRGERLFGGRCGRGPDFKRMFHILASGEKPEAHGCIRVRRDRDRTGKCLGKRTNPPAGKP